MGGLELNKIAAAVLLAGLIAMLSGTVTDILYKPHEKVEMRGYMVEVSEAKTGASGEAAAPVAIDIPALMASASAANGQKLIAKCSSCHNYDKGGSNKVGPELWDVIGRDRASGAGYSYSAAMKAKGGKWGYEDLYHFINNPKEFIPGTKMTFIGIKKPQDVADVIAFLRTLSDVPAALPLAPAKSSEPTSVIATPVIAPAVVPAATDVPAPAS